MSNTSKNRAVQALLLTAWIAIILVSQTTTPLILKPAHSRVIGVLRLSTVG